MSVQSDLEKLESDIRNLKIQYDMFFAGASKKQPFELKRGVESLIKKYSNSGTLSYAQRFLFNSLVSRYNAFAELWSKMLRDIEESGKFHSFAQMQERGVDPRNGKNLVASEIIGESLDAEKLKTLYTKYVDARKSTGEDEVKISLTGFSRQLLKQACLIKEKSNCNGVEIRIIIENKKVLIKAKAIKQEQETGE
ncbi:MAG: MXAN_5187 C-terminal domain-containing protein [Acidobacteriota bacterium]